MKNIKKSMMKKYYYKCTDIKVCCSDDLQNFINSLPNNSIVYFVDKTIFLSKRVIVENKSNIIFDGKKVKVISKFNPQSGFESYKGIFSFENCNNICLKNLYVDTDKLINITGKIINCNSELNYLDVKIINDFEFENNYKIFATNSMNKSGSADYNIFSEKPSNYEMLDSKNLRIKYGDELKGNLNKIYTGQRICIRFGTGNYLTLKNSMILFQNCRDFLLENIRIFSSPGYAIVIYPRCSNFTFKKYIVASKLSDKRLMASNVDALHVFGITGFLKLIGCRFSGLGDDALNIHSTAGTVFDVVSDEQIKVKNARFDINLEKEWCRQGDTLVFYDNNFNIKCYAIVKKYDNDTIILQGEDKVSVGDIVANTAFYANTTVKKCLIKNSRARGLLFQTQGIKVKKCIFSGISMPAVLMAPDVKRWHEVGPCDDVEISKNIFKNCNFTNRVENTGVITSSDSHDLSTREISKIHGTITIKNNIFIGNSKNISLKSVKNPVIKNNIYFGNKKN